MYTKDNALQNQFLLYSSTSPGNRLVYFNLRNPFDGSGYTLEFEEFPSNIFYKIQFLSDGGVRSIDTYFDEGNKPITPHDITLLDYGGYLEYNYDFNAFLIHNGDINDINVKMLPLNVSPPLSMNNTIYQVRQVLVRRKMVYLLIISLYELGILRY
jgi:hypothetical protein